MNKVYTLDYLEFLHGLPAASVDAVITDPPYGKQTKALWDRAVDPVPFMRECQRILKPTGYMAFTHQLPNALDWLVAAAGAGYKMQDHIVWCKRMKTAPFLPIMRSHESIFIYPQTALAQYYNTQAKWEDIAMPNYLDGLASIETLRSYITNLRAIVNGKGKPIQRSAIRANNDKYENYWTNKDYVIDRSPETTKLSNVWSFLPDAHHARNETHAHATIKPVLLFERLIDLLTLPGGVVVDPFVGSGTTVKAALNLNRDYIVNDLNPESAVLISQLTSTYQARLI